MIYKKWRPHLHQDIELIPVELAGRGKRITEPLYSTFDDVIDDVYSVVAKHIADDVPYAIFGHSMGSMVAYRLSQRIRTNRNMCMPRHMFFSGRGAPHVIRSDQKKYSKMPLDEFKREVIDLGGTTPEFFDYPDLMEIFLPLLKNDFFLAETVLCRPDEISPLPCDITVMAGREEDLTPEQIVEWKRHSHKRCEIHYLDGGHFFINTQTEEVASIINLKLKISRSENVSVLVR
jgi:surfactin synthase thioesterase subunit